MGAFRFKTDIPDPAEILRIASMRSGRQLRPGKVEEIRMASRPDPVKMVHVEILGLAPGQYGLVILGIAVTERLVEVFNNISTTSDVRAVFGAVNEALAELGGEPWVATKH